MRSPWCMARAIGATTGGMRLTVCLGCVIASQFKAVPAEPTNEEGVVYIKPTFFADPVRRDVLMESFLEEVSTSDAIVFDRFARPSSQLTAMRTQDSLGYGSRDWLNREGRNLFATIAVDGLRNAAAGALPLDEWEDRWQAWLGRLVSGMIGNAEEEHIELTSISYSAVRSSWETQNREAGIHFGFRPWRTNPYFYFLGHAGHLDGMPLITLEGRAGYTLLGSSRIEGRVTFQLPASFRLAGNASLDPGKVVGDDSGAAHFGVTLERVFRSPDVDSDSVFYVGFRSGLINRFESNPRQENLLLMGFSRRW